jgi:hypothetical protein
LGSDGTDRLWTPKHRVFCQGKDRDWLPVFDKIVEALKERQNVANRETGKTRKRA